MINQCRQNSPDQSALISRFSVEKFASHIRTIIGRNGFRRRAVARIACFASRRRVFFVARMMGYLALQRVVNKGFEQVFQQVFNFACSLAVG